MEPKSNVNESHLLKESSHKNSNGLKRKFPLRNKPIQASHSLLKKCKIEDIIPNCDTLNLSNDFKDTPICFRKTKKTCKIVNNSNDSTEAEQVLNEIIVETNKSKFKIKSEDSSGSEVKMVCSELGQFKKELISQESCSTDESSEIFCQICEKNLSHLNKQRQHQHINSCLDSQEEKSQQESSSEQENNQVIVLDCPMCGKAFKSLKARKVHLKRCVVENNTSALQMMILVHRQEKEVKKSQTAELLEKKSSKDLMPTHKEPKKVKKRTGNIPEPSNPLDADLQMAVALSNSLLEENSENLSPVLTDPGPFADVPKKKKMIKSEVVPTLLSRTREENQRLSAERIADIVFPMVNENISSTGVIKAWSDNQQFKCSQNSMLSSLMNNDCYLWNMASQYSVKNKTDNLFYVSSLSSLITPSKILPGSKLRRVSQIPGRGSSQPCSAHHCIDFREPDDDSLLLPTQTAGILAEMAEEAEITISPTKHLLHIPEQAPSELLYEGFFIEDSNISQQAEIIPSRIVKLLQDLENLLLSQQFSDLTVYVKNNESFQIHSSILSCRCPALLQEINSFSPVTSINWKNISLEAAKCFFKYLYYGNLDSSLDKDIAKELLQICNKYDHGYNDLTKHCNDLLNKKNSLDVDIEGALWSDDTSIDGESSNDDEKIYNIYELMETQIMQDSPPARLSQKSFKMISDDDDLKSPIKENICLSNSFEENLSEKIVINYDDNPVKSTDSLISKVVETNKIFKNKLKEELFNVGESPKMFENLNQSDISSSKSDIIPNTPFVKVESSRNYINLNSTQVDCKNNDCKTTLSYLNISLPQTPYDCTSRAQSPDLFAIEEPELLEENYVNVSTPVLSNVTNLQKHLFKSNGTTIEKCNNIDLNDSSQNHKMSTLVPTISSKMLFDKHSSLKSPTSTISSDPFDGEYQSPIDSPLSLSPPLENLNAKKLMNKPIILTNESNSTIINPYMEENIEVKCLPSIKSRISTLELSSDNASQNSALLLNCKKYIKNPQISNSQTSKISNITDMLKTSLKNNEAVENLRQEISITATAKRSVSPLLDITDKKDSIAMRSVVPFPDLGDKSNSTAIKLVSPPLDIANNSDSDDNYLHQFPLRERIASKSTSLFKLKNIPSPIKSSNHVPSASNFIIGQSKDCFKSIPSPDSYNSDNIIILQKSKLKTKKKMHSPMKLRPLSPVKENWKYGTSSNTFEDKNVKKIDVNSDEFEHIISPDKMDNMFDLNDSFFKNENIPFEDQPSPIPMSSDSSPSKNTSLTTLPSCSTTITPKFKLSPTPSSSGADSSPSKNTSVTPLPSYSAMITPNLKKELGKFGIRKALPRKKAVKLLKHIYEETHPYSEVERNPAETQNVLSFKEETTNTRKNSYTVEPNSVNEKNIQLCSSPAKIKATDTKIENPEKQFSHKNALNLSQTSSSSGETSQSDFPEESILLVEECFSQQDCSPNLTDQLFKLIITNEELHFQILHYQPLELNALQKLVKSSGIKCSQAKLMDFLDEQCITFTLGKEHQRRHHKQRNFSRKNNSGKKKD